MGNITNKTFQMLPRRPPRKTNNFNVGDVVILDTLQHGIVVGFLGYDSDVVQVDIAGLLHDVDAGRIMSCTPPAKAPTTSHLTQEESDELWNIVHDIGRLGT